jgi:hypothetical protein
VSKILGTLKAGKWADLEVLEKIQKVFIAGNVVN